MTYWEFLIQREDDRSWKTLTSPNLQIVEGKYRIVANTSAIDAIVRTQVFYHTDQEPPQLSQSRSQSVSPEGVLVVLPFTHLQVGIWQFKCNVSISEEEDICQSLKLKVLAKSVLINPPLSTSLVSSHSAKIEPLVEIRQTAIGDLDKLLDGLDNQQIDYSEILLEEPPTLLESPTPVIYELDEIAEDPFEAALRIATADREARTKSTPIGQVKTEPTLQQILAATTVEAIVLDTPDVPLHSYDVKTYEVVVED